MVCVCVSVCVWGGINLLTHFSTGRLIRDMATCLRFCHRCRHRQTDTDTDTHTHTHTHTYTHTHSQRDTRTHTHTEGHSSGKLTDKKDTLPSILSSLLPIFTSVR